MGAMMSDLRQRDDPGIFEDPERVTITESLLDKLHDTSTLPHQGGPSHSWLRGTTFSQRLLLFFTLFLASWGLFDISRRLIEGITILWASQHPPCWCGTSDLEALAMGCIYDHIAVDWLPPRCTDQDLIDEFDQAGPNDDASWPYYQRDAEYLFHRIDSFDIDSYAERGQEYWATVEWHVAHCLFTWRKQFRKGFSSALMEPWNMKEGHIVHCSEYIMETLREQRHLWEVDTWIPGRERHTDE